MNLKTLCKLTILGILLMMPVSMGLKAQTVKDANGNVYKTVKYGMQEWSALNLNVSKFRNGEIIPEAKTPEEWKNAGAARKPAWCYYNNDQENGKKYGKLYNWYAVNDPRGIAPKGWHVSKNPDWTKLIKSMTGIDIAGKKLKSKTEWKSNTGTDLIGFAALPAGFRNEEGKFESLGTHCQFWSNSVPTEVKKTNLIFSVVLSDNTAELKYKQMKKEAGLAVRIIKD